MPDHVTIEPPRNEVRDSAGAILPNWTVKTVSFGSTQIHGRNGSRWEFNGQAVALVVDSNGNEATVPVI